MSTASSWSPPAWPRAPGLWWCKHRDRRGADPEDEVMASKQTNKQAKSAAKADTGEPNKPARNRQCAPRRRTPQARSKSAAIQTSSAAEQAAVAHEGTSEGIDLSTNTTPSLEPQASQSKPPSE